MGLFSSLKDTFLGKKTAATAGGYTELDAGLKPALGMYNNELSKLQNQGPIDSSQEVGARIAQQERQATQGIQDQETRARDLLAQRGMGRSAGGISALLGIRSGLNDQISGIRAQAPGMMREINNENEATRFNRLNNVTGNISSILGTRMYNAPTAAQGRSGGLAAPLLSAGASMAGSALGGPIGGALAAKMFPPKA
jgi:hypothetical protein